MLIGFHHHAFRCRDAEETRRFYEDLLGLRLAHVERGSGPREGGGVLHYVHLFFEMPDGNYLVFIDLGDGEGAAPSPNTPGWVNHRAIEASSMAALAAAKKHLEAAGVEVTEPIDYHVCRSIYFTDPNGLRLEIAARWRTSERCTPPPTCRAGVWRNGLLTRPVPPTTRRHELVEFSRREKTHLLKK
ncbi:MAG: glyoxalase/bleomycin resistance protein/dioxygenase superfamily protein [Xanthobacteraceae bacterium]|jgi:catechol 2,3-dioxygenase-like lactoylglutathione lyase family enzyme|nr:glyoxalase/bleomycin resistance protein/dioxygenase superfamily protein [Xanthobacteraceae bacterium]